MWLYTSCKPHNKSLTAKTKAVVSSFWSAVIQVRAVTRHDLYDLDSTVFVFAVNVCSLPEVISICCSEFYFAVTVVGHRSCGPPYIRQGTMAGHTRTIGVLLNAMLQ